jgi:Phage tail assembly chaperone protein
MGDGRQAVMDFFIHYRPSDGEILGWGTSADPVPIEGMAIAFFYPFDPDPLTQKFDAATDRIVEKSAEEKRLARLPTLHEVQRAVFAELCRTDQFMVADCPITDDEYQAWRGYRFALRGLTAKRADPADLINGWPAPPDGVDPINDLRERLKP